MNVVKKNIKYIIPFVLIAIVTTFILFNYGEADSLEVLINELIEAEPKWILSSILAMFGFIIFEALAIKIIDKNLGGNGNLFKCIKYASADIFFSAITPSATGGQPVTAYLMVKDGMPVNESATIIFVNLVMYTISLILTGLLSIFYGFRRFKGFNKVSLLLIIIGLILLLLMLVFVIFILTNRKFLINVYKLLLNIGYKIHLIDNIDSYLEKFISGLDEYKRSIDEIKGQKLLLIKVFILNFLQRLSQSMVIVFCYMGLIEASANKFKVWSLGIISSLGASCLPVPGGMGVTDFLLVKGLRNISEIRNISNFILFTRGISFYTCVIVSAIILFILCLYDYRLKRRK